MLTVILYIEYAMICADALFTEWKTISISATTQKLVCRTNNRALVGFPYVVVKNLALYYSDYHPGRDPDWLDLTLQTAIAIVMEGFLIGHLPDFLTPRVLYFVTEEPVVLNWLCKYLAKFITKSSKRIKRGIKHLDLLIRERQKCMQEHGERWRERLIGAPYIEMR